MSYLLRPFWLLTLLLPLAISCTDSPENDPGAKDAPVIPPATLDKSLPVPKTIDLVQYSHDLFSPPGELEGIGSEGYEELKDKNLSAPIIYGVGAANISMDTTFVESKELLTPPFRGPFSDGLTVYNEQVYVIWQNEGERKPRMIIPIKGYLGKMDAGKFGLLDFQSKFPSYKQSGDIKAGAQKLIRELYLEFEQSEDLSYDCLATGRCTLIVGDVNQPNMVFVFPGAVLLMAKEEFQLAEVRIIRDIDPGILANNLDILSGDVLVPNQDPIPLGAYYHEIFERLQEANVKSNPDVYISTDSFGYSWKGFWYSFNRTDYDLSAIQAEFTDFTKAVQVSSEFPAYLTINGERILVLQTPDSVSFALEGMPNPETMYIDDLANGEGELQSKLKMTTPILKANAKAFVEGLTTLIKEELEREYSTVTTRIGGYQNEAKVNKEIYGTLMAFDDVSLTGKLISFKVSQEQKKLDYFVVSTISPKLNPFNKIVFPTLLQDVERQEVEQQLINQITGLPVQVPGTEGFVTTTAKSETFTELSGFKLNDLIRLTDIDALNRGEATAELLSASEALGAIKERVSFVEQGTIEVPDEKRLVARNQSAMALPFSGTVLGLKVIGADDQGQWARVVSVSSADVYGDIGDVCGLGDSVQFSIGMRVDEFELKLLEAIAEKKQQDPKYECNYIQGRDSGGKNFLKKVYFPDENLYVTFDNKALSSVNIYLPLNQVQGLPEVKND